MSIHISKFYHQGHFCIIIHKCSISNFQCLFFLLPTAHTKFGSRWMGRSPLWVSRGSKVAYCFRMILLICKHCSEVTFFIRNILSGMLFSTTGTAVLYTSHHIRSTHTSYATNKISVILTKPQATAVVLHTIHRISSEDI